MKMLLLPASLSLTAFALLVSAFQQPPATKAGSAPVGAITTLYAGDPLESSLSLLTGEPGLVEQDGEVRNMESHICMGYYPDSLAVGIQGGETGAIVDIGTAQEVAKGSSTRAVGNGGNVFMALGAPWIRKQAGLKRTDAAAHAPIKSGHIYLMRIVSEGKPEILAKLLVLEFRPGESVTFRWRRLEE